MLRALFILAISSTAVAGQDYPYIAHRSVEIQSKISSTKAPSVIVIGDSLTEAAPWPSEVCGLAVINGGASGSRTSYMLPLVEEFLRLNYHPAAIVIAIGMNDTHKTLWHQGQHERSFLASYRAIVGAAMSASRKVLLSTLSPVEFDAPIGNVIDPDAWQAMNADISKIGSEMNLPVIDVTMMKSELPLTVDGVHFTSEGNRLFVERIGNAVKNALHCD